MHGPDPKSLRGNIDISRPNHSAILDRCLEEKRGIEEFDKGFFMEKGFHVEYALFPILKNEFQGIVFPSFYTDDIK